MAEQRKTVVVNMFGGPGAGKTTAALEVAAKLKKEGYIVEYAPEYAKELCWEKNDPKAAQGDRLRAMRLLNGDLLNQSMIWEEQNARVKRLVGSCDFVVTDSPALLSCIYVKEPPDGSGSLKGATASFKQRWLEAFKAQENFNMFVERSGVYETQGRIHTEKQALAIDRLVKEYLEGNGIFYGSYDHDGIDVAIRNMKATLERVRGNGPGDAGRGPASGARESERKDGKAMAEENGYKEGAKVQLPRTGYKGKDLFEPRRGERGPYWSVKLPPHFPEVETVDGQMVDISNGYFTVNGGPRRWVKDQAGNVIGLGEGQVVDWVNDPNYLQVSFPEANRQGMPWTIDVKKFVRDADPVVYTFEAAGSFERACKQYRAERKQYAEQQRQRENRAIGPEPPTPAQALQEGREMANAQSKSAPSQEKAMTR